MALFRHFARQIFHYFIIDIARLPTILSFMTLFSSSSFSAIFIHFIFIDHFSADAIHYCLYFRSPTFRCSRDADADAA